MQRRPTTTCECVCLLESSREQSVMSLRTPGPAIGLSPHAPFDSKPRGLYPHIMDNANSPPPFLRRLRGQMQLQNELGEKRFVRGDPVDFGQMQRQGGARPKKYGGFVPHARGWNSQQHKPRGTNRETLEVPSPSLWVSILQSDGRTAAPNANFIKRIFSPFGVLHSYRCGRGDFSFVNYLTTGDAKRAFEVLNGSTTSAGTLVLKSAKPPPGHPFESTAGHRKNTETQKVEGGNRGRREQFREHRKQETPTCSLWVAIQWADGSFFDPPTPSEMRDMFQQSGGGIFSLQTGGNNYSFAHFDTIDSAQRAMEFYNGRKWGQDGVVRMRWAMPPPNHPLFARFGNHASQYRANAGPSISAADARPSQNSQYSSTSNEASPPYASATSSLAPVVAEFFNRVDQNKTPPRAKPVPPPITPVRPAPPVENMWARRTPGAKRASQIEKNVEDPLYSSNFPELGAADHFKEGLGNILQQKIKQETEAGDLSQTHVDQVCPVVPKGENDIENVVEIENEEVHSPNDDSIAAALRDHNVDNAIVGGNDKSGLPTDDTAVVSTQVPGGNIPVAPTHRHAAESAVADLEDDTQVTDDGTPTDLSGDRNRDHVATMEADDDASATPNNGTVAACVKDDGRETVTADLEDDTQATDVAIMEVDDDASAIPNNGTVAACVKDYDMETVARARADEIDMVKGETVDDSSTFSTAPESPSRPFSAPPGPVPEFVLVEEQPVVLAPNNRRAQEEMIQSLAEFINCETLRIWIHEMPTLYHHDDGARQHTDGADD